MGVKGKREAPASWARAAVPDIRPAPMTAAPEPKASTLPMKPRREMARSTTRSNSLSAGRGKFNSSQSSAEMLMGS